MNEYQDKNSDDDEQQPAPDFLDELAADSSDITPAQPEPARTPVSRRVHFDRYKIGEDKVLAAQHAQPESQSIDMPKKSLSRTRNAALKQQQSRKKLLIGGLLAAVVVVTGIAVVMGIIAQQSKKGFSEDDVTVTIEAPDKLKSGDEITYKIHGKNNNKATLTNAELVVTYPEKFSFSSSAPAASNALNTRWPLANLKTGDGFEIDITGRIVGEQGTVAGLQASLNYRPTNFNSDFSEQAVLNTTLQSPAVSLAVEYDKQSISGDDMTYTLRYTNTSNEIISAAAIQLQLPDNFTIKTAKPKATDEAKSLWKLGRLDPRESGTIEITGPLAGNEGETKRLTVQLGMLDDKDVLVVETEELAETKLVQSSVSLNQKINGAAAGTQVTVKPGDKITIAIDYKNTGSTGLKGVVITENLNTESLDLATASVVGGAIAGNTVTWNNSGVPELEVLDAGESGTVQMSVQVKKSLTLTAPSSKGLKITGTAELASTSLKDKIESNTVTAAIESVAKLAAEARYFDFENQLPVGAGPLPPKVGSTTTYRVYLTVTNTTNDLQSAVATIKLAPGVVWADSGQVSVGDPLKFNASTSKVTWTIGNIPAGTGNLTGSLEASFLVSITPTSNQVGKQVDLTADGGTLDAVDSITSTKLSSTDQKLTTHLEFDDNARGKDSVAP